MEFYISKIKEGVFFIFVKLKTVDRFIFVKVKLAKFYVSKTKDGNHEKTLDF